MKNVGAFCEVYGVTIRNRVIEYLLENQDIDFAIGDMAKEIDKMVQEKVAKLKKSQKTKSSDKN